MAGFMTEHPAPLAIVRTTDDLRQLFRQRVAYLGITWKHWTRLPAYQ
jgi:hypothetical protein